MLHPQSSGGTPQSIQVRSLEMSVRSDRFPALATDIDDGVATELVQGPSPLWVDASQQEYPRQRRRLQLISQSSRVSSAGVAFHVDVGKDEMRVSADHDSESDTESFPARSQTRLSLQWRADPDDVADVADSHDMRFLRVRRAMQLERRQEQFGELAADPQPLGPICPRRGWEALDTVDLQAKFRCRVHCLQAVPSFLRGQFRMALVTSLEAMRAAYHSGDHTKKVSQFSHVFQMDFSEACMDPPRQSWREGWTVSTHRSRRCCWMRRDTVPQVCEGRFRH